MSDPKQGDSAVKKARVFLVDDHPVVRNGLAELINLQSDLTVCGEAEDMHGASKGIADLKPDIAVVDLSLDKDVSGLELIKNIKLKYPDLVVLVLSMYDEMVYAGRALRAGASGYVTKHEAMETVLTAIRQVWSGEIYVSGKVVKQVLSGVAGGRIHEAKFPTDCLTDREMEILQLIGRGFGTSRIAEQLYISAKMVETHRMHIKQKLHLTNSAELIEYAVQWARTQEQG